MVPNLGPGLSGGVFSSEMKLTLRLPLLGPWAEFAKRESGKRKAKAPARERRPTDGIAERAPCMHLWALAPSAIPSCLCVVRGPAAQGY
jgi:hypothetical protein